MIIKDAPQVLTIEVTTTTGVYEGQTNWGPCKTRTSRTLIRKARVHILVTLDEKTLNEMIRTAYKNKSKKCVDGPLVVIAKELELLSEEQKPCFNCGQLHDGGIPCGVRA